MQERVTCDSGLTAIGSVQSVLEFVGSSVGKEKLVPEEATGILSNAIAVTSILPTDHKGPLLKSADVEATR
jgi:hypothetical protein